MRFIESRRAAGLAAAAWLVACSPPAPPPAQPAPVASLPAPPPAPAPAASVAAAPPVAARKEDALKLMVAQRIVVAHPTITYDGPAPDPLLAIPVLLIELNADGSVRRIEVLRQPRQARDTIQLAIDAVRKAAPYGDLTRFPKPWKFTESFLFDDERRFKPRTLER